MYKNVSAGSTITINSDLPRITKFSKCNRRKIMDRPTEIDIRAEHARVMSLAGKITTILRKGKHNGQI